MEQKKPIEQLYQEKFGINEKVREERLQELLSSLDQAVETQDLEIATDLAEVTEGKVLINGRVKSLERLKEKIERVGYKFEDNFDGWGLQIVVSGDKDETKAVSAVEGFQESPSEEDLTRTNGFVMPEFIVSGPQTSSASHGEFRALTIFRKSQYGIVSVRVIQKDIYERTQDPNDELYHAKYVERQRELGN